jgi:phosphoenolpyruvate carboxykinase (GTP)
VLKWIVDRCHGRTDAEETALGWVPTARSFDLQGLEEMTPAKFDQLQAINHEEWRREIIMQEDLFMRLYSHIPKELIFQRELLVARL